MDASNAQNASRPQRNPDGSDGASGEVSRHREVGAEELRLPHEEGEESRSQEAEPPATPPMPIAGECQPVEGEEGKYEHCWKCSCYPRIDSYDGPSWELERVLSGRQNGPCRTRRLPDFSKPLSRCSNYEIGAMGEDLAEKYLVRKGWEILARNYRTPMGEADIVAKDPDGELVMVEVKSRYVRGTDALSMPEIAVDFNKQRRYQDIGLFYISTHAFCDDVRFDVIAVNMMDGHRAQLRHLEAAFSCDDQGARGL